MKDTTNANDGGHGMSETAAAVIWIGLVTAGSVLGSLAFACAAPLAAMAAIAGLKMRAREGIALVGAAWLANQLVGYLVLDYPQTVDSFAWGAMIGIASLLGFFAAAAVARVRASDAIVVVAGLAAAFLSYEAVLFAATPLLGGSETAFSAATVLRILEVNVVAFAVLLLLHRAAVAMRFLPRIAAPQPAAA